MLFYVPEERQQEVRKALSGLREMDFTMDNSGTTVIHFEKDFI